MAGLPSAETAQQQEVGPLCADHADCLRSPILWPRQRATEARKAAQRGGCQQLRWLLQQPAHNQEATEVSQACPASARKQARERCYIVQPNGDSAVLAG